MQQHYRTEKVLMVDQNNENLQSSNMAEPVATKKQWSKLALWAFRCAVIGSVFLLVGRAMNSIVVGVFLALALLGLAFVLGIFALAQIYRSKGKLMGVSRSVVAIFMIFLWRQTLLSNMSREPAVGGQCGYALCQEVGLALTKYCNDHNGKFPPASQWCDLLEERVDVANFVCPGSDAIKGESSYAMNKYIADVNTFKLPEDIVVLFETDYGRMAKRGWWKLRQMRKKTDEYYSISKSNNIPKLMRSDKLDKLRWNQVGGPEILTTEHHDGGCNILYGDGHVSFETKESISKLRWKP
jgi:prepilin-type processing-associated H-X9-DG protein